MTEVELIEKLTQKIKRKKGGLKTGIGDDCSVIRIGSKDILISCDSLVENIHFRKKWASWETWGVKATGAALSDIAAMGGIPRFAWVNLSVPRNLKAAEIQKFYRGLLKVFRQFSTTIAGGNISSSPKGFSCHLTVWGEAPAGKAMLRSKAKPGDKVYVSGKLGSPSFLPTPQIRLGTWLRKKGCCCCIDVSDGLLKDLNHIAQASKVKIVLQADKIPYKGDLKKAITRGEDYVLAFTHKGLESRVSSLESQIAEIGFVKKGTPEVQVLDNKGNLISFPKLGFDHKIKGR